MHAGLDRITSVSILGKGISSIVEGELNEIVRSEYLGPMWNEVFVLDSSNTIFHFCRD